MQYYVARNGQATGPFSHAQLLAQLESGEISEKDLAWHDGAPDWKPLSKVAGFEHLESISKTVAPPEPQPNQPPRQEQTVPKPSATNQVVAPVKQADTLTNFKNHPPAGFWKRAIAYVIDYMILSISSWIITVILTLVLIGGLAATDFNGQNSTGVMIGFIAMYVVVFALWIGYYAAFESSKSQATPGKLVLGLVVTDLQGERISMGRGIGRNLAKILSAIPLLIGFFLAGFTARKQALHDLMGGTLVVDKDPKAGSLPGWAIALLAIVVGFVMVAILGIIAAIALPAYKDYTVRAKVVQVSNDAAPIKLQLSETMMQYGEMPDDLEELDKPPMTQTSYAKFHLEDGVLVATISNTNTDADTQTLAFEPMQINENEITWRCGYNQSVAGTPMSDTSASQLTTLNYSYLPPACK